MADPRFSVSVLSSCAVYDLSRSAKQATESELECAWWRLCAAYVRPAQRQNLISQSLVRAVTYSTTGTPGAEFLQLMFMPARKSVVVNFSDKHKDFN